MDRQGWGNPHGTVGAPRPAEIPVVQTFYCLANACGTIVLSVKQSKKSAVKYVL